MSQAGTNAGMGQWAPNRVIQAVILARSLVKARPNSRTKPAFLRLVYLLDLPIQG